MKPPRKPKKTVRKRKKHGTVRVIAAFDTPCKHQWFNRTDMNLRVCKLCNLNQVINPPDYAAVGERVKVPLSMPPAVEAYMDELQPATGHTGYAPSYDPNHDPNHDPKPPVESTMKDIADEMRRVQDGETIIHNSGKSTTIELPINPDGFEFTVQPKRDPLLEIPPPELPQGVSQGIDVVKCLGVIIVILVFCLTLTFYGGMLTQSQLPQKPRLSEINLCMHLGKHWDSAKGECE